MTLLESGESLLLDLLMERRESLEWDVSEGWRLKNLRGERRVSGKVVASY